MNENKALELSMEYNSAVLNSERWADFADRSKRGSDYYVGQQTFSEQQKAQLMSEGKPHLIFNQILPIINYLTSLERDNRKDAKVVERRGGYANLAELLTELMKHVMDMCDGDYVKSEVFLNGIKSCIGWFKAEIDFEREPVNGQIIIRSRPSLAIKSDPACLSYDLNDTKNGAQYVIDSDWVTRDKLKSQYPGKAKDIDQALEDYVGSQGRGFVNRMVDYLLNNTVDTNEDDSEVIFDSDIMNIWRSRVHETWFKEYVSRTLICDKRNWEVWYLDPKKKSDGIKLEKAKEIASQHPQVFEIREKQSMPLLHKLKRVGELVLEHVEDPFNGMSNFPLIPFSPLGETQYDMGMVDNLIGPQDELNKRMTNVTHILGQTANGGMIIGSDKHNYAKTLRDFGSANNFVVERDKCGDYFEKIQPSPISSGHMDLQQVNKNYMEEISGVTGASRGQDPERQESGRLYQQKVKQSITTNQVIFDRFDYSWKILSQTVMEMIRHTDTYTEQEISYMIKDKDLVNGELMDKAREQVMQKVPPPQSPLENPNLGQMNPEDIQVAYTQYEQKLEHYTKLADEQAIEIAKDELMTQLKAYRSGIYSIVIIQSPNAPTTQISNFLEMNALRDMVPPEILAPYMIRATGMPKDQKEEMAEKIESLIKAGQEQPQQPQT